MPVSVVVVAIAVVTILSLPCTFNLFVVMVAMFVASAVYAAIVSPALGLLILVILEFWCDAILFILASNVVHCAAVIVAPALTLLTVVLCP